MNVRLVVVWDAETTRKPALGPARQPRVAGPPESNLKSTTAIFSVPKDRLGCRRTRKSHRREAFTRGPYRQPVPGVSSPAARKCRKFARWPYLPRPDFALERTGPRRGGLPGGGVTPSPDARAPGSVLGPVAVLAEARAPGRVTVVRVSCTQRVLQPRRRRVGHSPTRNTSRLKMMR